MVLVSGAFRGFEGGQRAPGACPSEAQGLSEAEGLRSEAFEESAGPRPRCPSVDADASSPCKRRRRRLRTKQPEEDAGGDGERSWQGMAWSEGALDGGAVGGEVAEMQPFERPATAWRGTTVVSVAGWSVDGCGAGNGEGAREGETAAVGTAAEARPFEGLASASDGAGSGLECGAGADGASTVRAAGGRGCGDAEAGRPAAKRLRTGPHVYPAVHEAWLLRLRRRQP